MPLFKYKALDFKGHVVKDIAYSENLGVLDHELLEKKCRLLKARPFFASRYGLHKSIDLLALCDFFFYLHQFLQQKATFTDALDILIDLTRCPPLQAALHQIRYHIQNGIPISSAFKKSSAIFDSFIIQNLHHAERTGNLDYACKIIHLYLEDKITFLQNRQKALFYPLCVFAVIFILITLNLRYIVPTIREFLEASAPSGLGERMLFSFSDLSLKIPLSAQFAFLGILFLGLILKNNNKGPAFFRFFLGSNTHYLWISWTQTIAMSLKSGITIKDALEASLQSIENKPIDSALHQIFDNVVNGSPLHEALEGTRALPLSIVKFSKIGESCGNLGDMLLESAKIEQKKLAQNTEKMLQCLQPSLLILAGGLLLWILFSTLVPLYNTFSL